MHEPGADRAYQNLLSVCPQGEGNEQEAPIITTGSNGQEPFFSGRMRGIGIDSRRLTEHRLDLCPCNPVLPAFGPVALIPFESSDPDVLHVRRLHFCTYIHKQRERCRRPVCDAGHRGARVGAVGAAGEEVVPARGAEGDENEARLGHAGTPSMESDLPKGYRGAAERSSNVGVPECDVGVPERAARRSSNVGVPEFRGCSR